jgi:anti-sigma factor RsiW
LSDSDARLARLEQLLEERNALAREAMAMQREALAEQKELTALSRANIERAAEVNRQAAQVAGSARQFMLLLLPVVIVLIGYLSWLLFFKLGLR